MMRRHIVWLAIASCLGPPVAVSAQPERTLALKPATGRLNEEFTAVASVRELADGRVLIADRRDGRLVVADFMSGAVEPVGRKGQGPGEYASPWALFPLAGDSTFLLDQGSRRWHLLHGASIVATLSPDSPILRVFQGVASGADQLGNVWCRFESSPQAAGTTKREGADSSYIVVGTRATARIDTVGKLREIPMTVTIQKDATGKVVRQSASMPAYAIGEEAVLFPDGWLAIARLAPYRIDWRAPDGRITLGRPVPLSPVRFDSRERDAFLTRNAKEIEDIRTNPRIPPDFKPDMMRAYSEFPDAYPPFELFGLLASPNGDVVVRKPVTAAVPSARYDVINRRAGYRGTVQLGKSERIVGFGPKSVYIAWKDDDDIERVRWHPWD